MVDTQADISLVKKSVLSLDSVIDIYRKTNIFGVTDGVVQSHGVIQSLLLFNEVELDQEFSFPIPADGILGKDFIKDYKYVLNYENMMITIKPSSGDEVEIPMSDSALDDYVYLPPRCEVYQGFKINSSVTQDKFVDSQELEEGVFVARTIISDNTPVLRILNTKSEAVKLKRYVDVKMENVSNFDVYSFGKQDDDRVERLVHKISKNVPGYADESLMDLC